MKETLAVNERERLKLYDRLGELLGPDDAGTLMELLPPNGWDDIATKELVAANATALRGEMAQLRADMNGEMARLRSEMNGEMGQLRSEMHGGFAGVTTEFAAVRGEIVALGSSLRTEMASMQRNLFLVLAGFMLTIWITLLFA